MNGKVRGTGLSSRIRALFTKKTLITFWVGFAMRKRLLRRFGFEDCRDDGGGFGGGFSVENHNVASR